ncbi:MAG: hypothetical protein A3H45_07125 [Ignavibacteria bacterium RIFCSPLOWO2_02_FULL_55_14]|nr:MAG: hypothetical protein A2X68_02155 [Ignavibacteria bacterium GWC2_56_12]OGU73568.1 MAG: hypothetical protein A3G43_00605 [Ignavibacteria bacterium RIFCSPLOWO2_12_FULL_56_21]OGU74128.1 MAG: hypothetical protein A3H45_07125 [Ignavibacteria bacterium RIFCSPLOWO2_02_FULL_55_14]HAV24063.1 hypothetical protein [Bacteroidota bacterium]
MASWEEKKIGNVVDVTSTTVQIMLDPDIGSLTRKIGEKTYFVGQIGTYVLVPIGQSYVIGIVSESRRLPGLNGEVGSYRIVTTLIGTIRKGKYEPGVSVLPSVDMPVYLLEDKDIRGAFSAFQQFNFSIGNLSMFENERAYLNPNKFFGKHIAILGSSGSGKSHTVASVLQKVTSLPETHVVILDLHNEYRQAFPESGQYCEISSLELPYWLLNFDEIREMFIDPNDENASIQMSLLQDLIAASKKEKNPRLAEVLTIDSPVNFDLAYIRGRLHFLDTEKSTGTGGGREGPFFGKLTRLVARVDTKMNDSRYAFMFKPKLFAETESAVSLLMMLFGLSGKSRVTIMDLSGVPSDILKTIVALLARLTFDFNFWNPNRSELPILLVFEEAHNYLSLSAEGSVAARKTVERIAKEGRKYGVSCMIVSQRPAEISETILSQCSNFVLLRLLNPNDQMYIKRLVPESFSGLEAAISLLRQGEGIIVGDAIPMPQRVQIDPPDPPPLSSDVLFFDKWKKSSAKTDPHEVLERWWNQQRN